MNKKLSYALVCAFSLFANGYALAQKSPEVATLKDLDGKVLVNKGEGLKSAAPGMDLVDGNRIVTLDKSSVRIVFGDGCDVRLKENEIFVIDAKLGCKALVTSSSPAATGLTSGQIALIGAGVVGVGIIIGSSGGGSSNDNRPISSQ